MFPSSSGLLCYGKKKFVVKTCCCYVIISHNFIFPFSFLFILWENISRRKKTKFVPKQIVNNLKFSPLELSTAFALYIHQIFNAPSSLTVASYLLQNIFTYSTLQVYSSEWIFQNKKMCEKNVQNFTQHALWKRTLLPFPSTSHIGVGEAFHLNARVTFRDEPD